MWTGVTWWNHDETSVEARQRLCDLLGWPHQWAEGPADHEWLTDEQFEQLRAVELMVLDAVEQAERD